MRLIYPQNNALKLFILNVYLQQKLKEVTPPNEIKKQYFSHHPTKFEAYSSLYDLSDTTNQFEILSYIRPLGNRWITTYYGQPEYYHMWDSLHMSEAIFGSPNVSKYASSIINPLSKSKSSSSDFGYYIY
nr:hypothetical protein [uncultured Sphingobacterium sp.]